MSARPVVLSSLDVELLRSLASRRDLVAACRELGIGRDRGTYRLRRLARALGKPVAEGRRGGRGHGATGLTDAGRALLRLPPGIDVGGRSIHRASPIRLWGRYRPGHPPTVLTQTGVALAVAFQAIAGERVALALDPESVVIARERFATSARNVLPARVVAVRRRGPGASANRWTLEATLGRLRVPVAVTPEAVRSLGLAPGVVVYLYVKATALPRIDRAATRGSPRS